MCAVNHKILVAVEEVVMCEKIWLNTARSSVFAMKGRRGTGL